MAPPLQVQRKRSMMRAHSGSALYQDTRSGVRPRPPLSVSSPGHTGPDGLDKVILDVIGELW